MSVRFLALAFVGLAPLIAVAQRTTSSVPATDLVRELGQFPAALSPRVPGPPYEQRREAIYAQYSGIALDLVPFLPQLMAALRDEDERIIGLAAQALGHLGARGVVAVPEFLRMLDDHREGLRNSACIGPAGIGPAARDALPALRRTLNDPSDDVRRFARHAIGRIEQPQP